MRIMKNFIATPSRKALIAAANAVMVREGITKTEFRARLKQAELYHNPRNWSDLGQDLRRTLGVPRLFNDELARIGHQCRFYFFFKDVDCTSKDELVKNFFNCDNYQTYLELWQQKAPWEYHDEIYFLLMLVNITYRGMKNEEDQIKKNGWARSTGQEDYFKGIDAWTADGQPVQIKSPATQKGIEAGY